MTRIQKISHNVNGVEVEQRLSDGFINGTAMSVAHSKDLNDWFTTKDTLELFAALADDLGVEIKTGDFRNLDASKLSATKYVEIFPGLILSKRGSPLVGGGTWLHPDLAIQLAQWCNKPFAIQVSRWVREWMTTRQNPIWNHADIDRIGCRDGLRTDSRLRMTDQVKLYLEKIKRYDDEKYRGIFFIKVHDSINREITGETAKQMRERLSKIIGKQVKQDELIRDYYPTLVLQKYIAMCEAVANFIIRERLHPITAIERAAEIVLPANYIPISIDFVEHIKLVRGRVATLQK